MPSTLKQLLEENNRLLRQEIKLLKGQLCFCPKEHQWFVVGAQCPIHGDIEKRIRSLKK